ncbi:multicopper oxidase-domain-containing protein [Thelonectria olida]|uniref:Multicopper oxidase-domain-containing protein n=1 Tax=Thelonectria olida TaxID=1576542 RepID=A0A9P8W1K7_9HYPO|nr:multicopper oxidase-domain-containing protein [Thelonectria olida]
MGNTASAQGDVPGTHLAARANHINRYSPHNLGGSWPQSRTNGKSVLGTEDAPTLPYFLTNNPTPNGFPWSKRNAFTNYYKDHPNTGVIRSYDFTISRGKIAPDGYEIDGLLVNGGFPGPTIEANWGDTIQVTVHNDVDDEGVALHWHGFLQTRTPWEDGVPGITQCPIAPGKSFTYQFIAELYGSSWYHSHYSAQYAAGLIGPIVIHGPREHRDYDVDVGPILLNDWYHTPYMDLVETVMAANGPGIVFSDNNLINGKNNFNCSTLPADDKTTCNSAAGLSKFTFKRGKTHRLRLINSGAEALQRFSIDGHTMKVIAYDYIQIQPYDTKVVTLGIGQRADVLVKANGKLNSYWMRANISAPCSLARNTNALAAIYYDKADQTKQPQSTAWDVPDPATCVNDDLATTKPLMKVPLPNAELTYDLEIELFKNDSGVNLFKFDGVDFRTNYNSPTLLLSKLGETDFKEQWNVRNVGKAKSVRLNIINNTPIPHPMHMHGFNMYILNEGDGAWDGTIVNRNNPMRRDVIQVRGNGHVVVQFDAATNPGVWPLHCHIAWHVSAGLLIQFLTQPAQVKNYRIPNTIAQTCRDWGKWTLTNIPVQIDSGL